MTTMVVMAICHNGLAQIHGDHEQFAYDQNQRSPRQLARTRSRSATQLAQLTAVAISRPMVCKIENTESIAFAPANGG